jgi:hypothetical protein
MYLIKENLNKKLAQSVPLIDGAYEGYFYSWILEINGIKYPTLYGVKCSKECCGGLKSFTVKSGCVYQDVDHF